MGTSTVKDVIDLRKCIMQEMAKLTQSLDSLNRDVRNIRERFPCKSSVRHHSTGNTQATTSAARKTSATTGGALQFSEPRFPLSDVDHLPGQIDQLIDDEYALRYLTVVEDQ